MVTVASRLAAGLVRAAALVAPSGQRHDFRREWSAELAWCRAAGRSGADQCRRAAGALRHAWWLRRESWRWDVFAQDLRYAARALAARPGLATVAIVSLALGIGANVGIFTVVNGVLLRPLPFADPDRIVQFVNGEGPATLSGPEVLDVVRDSRALEAVGAYAFADGNVTGGRGDAERVRLARVSAGFFDVLSPAFTIGRPFSAGEDRPGAPDVIVISHGLAERYFDGAAAAAGSTMRVNGVPRQVVGVLPAGFDFPTPAVDVWTPLAIDPASPGERRNHSYRVVGRLSRGADVRTAAAEITGMEAAWRQAWPGGYNAARPFVTDAVPIADRVVGATRPYLVALAGAAGAVLLIACVNVASLLLMHGESRRADVALAAALGASRARLASRSMAESLWLAGAGGLAGVLLAWPVQRALLALAPTTLPRLAEIRIDPAVVAFAAAVTMVTAVASGLVPLWWTSRGAASAASLTARSTVARGGRATRRTQSVLIAAEVALATVLLAGAGMFTASLLRLQRIDLGYDPRGVATAKVSLPRATYTEDEAAAAVRAMVEALRAAPGVEHAAALAWAPVIEGGGMWSVMSDHHAPASNADAPLAAPQQVTPEFFETLSIPILRGRPFTPADRSGAGQVAVVNESFARLLWDDADPIGRRFRMFSPTSTWVTVVGLAGDTRVDGLADAKPPVMYFPHEQARHSAYFTSLTMTLAAKASGASAPVYSAIREAVRQVDADVPVSELRGLDDIVGTASSRERFAASIVASFAALAAILAGVGLFGVISYGVAQRQREFGLRLALGAGPGRIVRHVLRQGLTIAGLGLALGVAASAAAGRVLQGLVGSLEPIDAPVLLGAAAALAIVTLAALAVPARRAVRIDPLSAVRD
jgi:predicted permease